MAIVLIMLCIGVGIWSWYLFQLPLEEADSRSSVLSGFASVVFGVFGLIFGFLAMRRPPEPPATPRPRGRATKSTPESPPGSRSVQIGGDVHGPVVTGDDNIIGK
ncbi:hypothetical protein [Streptosporangium sp. NPDC000509]|uniref:hypothetical protein n=1 Tax=Streptosporangium sp. NPDC000509 TaxID=3366186 RepID=UPI0036BA4E2C